MKLNNNILGCKAWSLFLSKDCATERIFVASLIRFLHAKRFWYQIRDGVVETESGQKAGEIAEQYSLRSLLIRLFTAFQARPPL